MFFYISKITSLFVEPVGIVLLVLIVAVVLRLLGRRRAAWWGIGVTIGYMAIVIFTPLDYWLLGPLESRFPIPAAPACLNGIIVLGGGEDILRSHIWETPLLAGAPMRYVVLSELMRRYPDAKVVFSGGSGILEAHMLSEADVSKGIMVKLDLDLSRVTFESDSRNTWENAVNAKKIAHPRIGERWALLAPAAQMPRAVGSFRKVEWNVLPWPTDFTSGLPDWGLTSPLQRFDLVNEGEHEWLGLIAYWMTGRSSDLIPSPSIKMRQKTAC